MRSCLFPALIHEALDYSNHQFDLLQLQIKATLFCIRKDHFWQIYSAFSGIKKNFQSEHAQKIDLYWLQFLTWNGGQAWTKQPCLWTAAIKFEPI